MCEPVTMAAAGMSMKTMMMASLAVSAASAGLNYVSGVQNANAQVEAQNRNIDNQRQAALEAQSLSNNDINQRIFQERAASALKIKEGREKIDRAQATAAATSQSAGLSFDSLMQDYENQYSGFRSSQLQQLGFNVDQMERTREGMAATNRSRVNSITRTPVATPSLIGSALEFGGDALNTVNAYKVKDPFDG